MTDTASTSPQIQPGMLEFAQNARQALLFITSLRSAPVDAKAEADELLGLIFQVTLAHMLDLDPTMDPTYAASLIKSQDENFRQLREYLEANASPERLVEALSLATKDVLSEYYKHLSPAITTQELSQIQPQVQALFERKR